MENISKAFKSLDELLVESPVYLTEVEEPAAGTIRDLFANDASYNVLHDFDIDGVKYSLYAEATHGGESCDATFGEFDPDNIDGAIVDLLDADRNFIGTLAGATPDTAIGDAEAMAGGMIGGDAPVDASADEPISGAEAETAAEEAEPIVGEQGTSSESATQPPLIATDDGNGESDDAVHIKYKGKDITVSDVKDESLTESKSVDISSKEEMEDAKAELEKKSEEPVEKIVDASAEAVDDLRKSYIGSMILRCPTCHTMIYKDAEELAVDEEASTDDEKIYNTADECPHCGAKDGYELIGQVASLDADEEPTNSADASAAEEAEPIPDERPEGSQDAAADEAPSDSPDVKESLADANKTSRAAIEKATAIGVKSVSEARFDRLIRNYLKETYYNVCDYRTSSVSMDEASGTVSMDGEITFKSGKAKPTRFVFESAATTKAGKIKLLGRNDSISDRKAFTLTCSCDGGKLLSESMTYCYRIGDEPVRGRVSCPRRR